MFKTAIYLSGLLEALVPLKLQEAQEEELQGDKGQGRESVVLGARLVPLGCHTQKLLQWEQVW